MLGCRTLLLVDPEKDQGQRCADEVELDCLLAVVWSRNRDRRPSMQLPVSKHGRKLLRGLCAVVRIYHVCVRIQDSTLSSDESILATSCSSRREMDCDHVISALD